jgi:hypothetical protein
MWKLSSQVHKRPKNHIFIIERRRCFCTVVERRSFFDQLANKLKIQNPSDWYNIKLGDIADIGVTDLKFLKGFELHDALQQVYPEVSKTSASIGDRSRL